MADDDRSRTLNAARQRRWRERREAKLREPRLSQARDVITDALRILWARYGRRPGFNSFEAFMRRFASSPPAWRVDRLDRMLSAALTQPTRLNWPQRLALRNARELLRAVRLD